MSTVAAPFGIRPVFSPTGVIRPGPLAKIESAYATTIYQNSPVKVDANGFLTAAAAGQRALGVFQGVEYTDLTGRRVYLNKWIASTVLPSNADIRAYWTIDQPGLVYEVQADDTLSLASIGQQYDWTTLAGNDVTGLSSVALDVSTAAANAGLRVIGLNPGPDNDWDDDFPIVLVQFSEHQYTADIASV